MLSRESVLSAELRLFKKSAKNIRQYSTQHEQITLEVYHVYNTIDRVKPRKRLVDEKRVNLTTNGWLQFNVTTAFHMSAYPDDVDDDNNVKEFQIKIKNDNLDLKKEISFTKEPQKKRNQNRTPLLVLFLNDNAIAQKDIVLPLSERGSGETVAGSSPVDVLDSVEYKEDKYVQQQHANSKRELRLPEYNSNNYELESRTDVVKRDTRLTSSKGHRRTENDRLYANEADDAALSLLADDRTRRRRATPTSRRANRLGRNKCQLYDFYVDFQKVGWSDWIIAPNGKLYSHLSKEVFELQELS